MSAFSRRSFLSTGAAAAIPFSVWFEQRAAADSPRKRYNALSIEGRQMLALYNTGVAKMMDQATTPLGSPISWLFQWYTHSVKTGVTKDQELARVYPGASPWKSLAAETWSTCEAHVPGSVEKFFLPWHRMYVFFFERIVRKLTDPSFTLPYWDYTGPTTHGILPEAFRSRADPAFQSLYVEGRNQRDLNQGWADVNSGEPIDKYQQGKLNLDSLQQTSYQPAFPEEGFCQHLDNNLHGNVHVYVGNQTNMGNVPWAAKDPVFWAHHCNIDRLWASWAIDPCRQHTTPTGDSDWQAREFIFADENGNRVSVKASDVDELSKMDYVYDQLEQVTPLDCAAPASNLNPLITLRTPGSLSLTAAAAAESLGPPTGGSPSFVGRIRNMKKPRRVFLVLRNLRTNLAPGVVYHVFLDLPDKISTSSANAHFVGQINFFGATEHEAAAGHAAMSHSDDRFFSWDVTNTLRAMAQSGVLGEKPKVTIAPFGRPAAGATPLVGDISFVEFG